MSGGQYVTDDILRDEINHSVVLDVGKGELGASDAVLRFKKTINGLFLEIKSDAIPADVKKAYLCDYEAIDEDGSWLIIKVSDIPMRKIKRLIDHLQNRPK